MAISSSSRVLPKGVSAIGATSRVNDKLIVEIYKKLTTISLLQGKPRHTKLALRYTETYSVNTYN